VVREEVHQLAALDPALGALPELRLEQVGVVAQEELAQARVAEQEGRELLGEDVVAQDAVPGLGCQLRLGVRRRRDAAEVDVAQVLDLVVVVEDDPAVSS